MNGVFRKATPMAAALAVSLGSYAHGAEVEFEGVRTVQVLERVSLPAGKEVGSKRPILEQHLLHAGEAKLEMAPGAEEAFRDRYNLGGRAPLLLSEWVANGPGASRHLAYVYCASRIALPRGQVATCFRDQDGDGKLDGWVEFAVYKRTSPRLDFQAIEPAPYSRTLSDRSFKGVPMTPQPRIVLQYELDDTGSKLAFRARGLEVGFRADVSLEPVVEVSLASLPATVEVAGAKLQVLAWDGKRARIAVEAPMTEKPVALEAPDGGGVLLGKPKGYSLLISEVPLP